MASIKKNPKIRKECTHCFNPTHLIFNFSFCNYQDGFEGAHKEQFVKRIFELSKEPYLVVANWPKERGFETVAVDISKHIDPKYYESENRTFDGKYTIIRLYTNNNPLPSRIIGKLSNKIFYVFFIDIKGNLYSH